MQHLHAMILAGGSGTRLWPLSTPAYPKQFLPLPNGRSMIQETLVRVEDLLSPDRLWVVTGKNIANLVQEHLPTLQKNHLLAEPMGKNSAAAIGWAAATIARTDPEAVMASFHADAIINNVHTLQNALKLAYEIAETGKLVTIGITPTAPETGYGYIHYGEQVQSGSGHQAYISEQFVEKPDLATAQSYLDDGHYVWNGGIFVWKVKTILEEFEKYLPDSAMKLASIAEAMGTDQEQEVLNNLWPTLQSISIDHAILERTKNLVVIPSDLGWNDVGNWEQYGSLFAADQHGIHAVGPHTNLDCQNLIVYNNTDRQIFTIGVDDLIVVEMEDKTVICHKSQVQRVKELAEQQQKLKQVVL